MNIFTYSLVERVRGNIYTLDSPVRTEILKTKRNPINTLRASGLIEKKKKQILKKNIDRRS